jgi:type I site-specific restriction endonuclease
MNKKELSERDICTKFITPALEQTGWDIATQVREEFPLTKGRIIVRGKLHTRAQNKRADYVLFHKPNMPIAVIEAKDINEDYDKYYFTIIDFKKATELFPDPDFDGDPVQIYEPKGIDSPVPPDEGEGLPAQDGFTYPPTEESPWSGVTEPRPGEEGSSVRR